jgi:hypothetical protein
VKQPKNQNRGYQWHQQPSRLERAKIKDCDRFTAHYRALRISTNADYLYRSAHA